MRAGKIFINDLKELHLLEQGARLSYVQVAKMSDVYYHMDTVNRLTITL
jgi:hypothetical protein